MSNKKIKIKGWVDSDEETKSNIPSICPKCGRKLNHVDGLQTCGMYMVYCMNLKCRYCEIYIE